MSLALYLDENVPRAVGVGLRLRGIDVITPQEDGRRGIADPQLLDRATELGRPLFSQDEDLLAEARQRQEAGIPFSGVLYADQLHVTIGDCVRDLYLIAEVMEAQDLVSRVEFLPSDILQARASYSDSALPLQAAGEAAVSASGRGAGSRAGG